MSAIYDIPMIDNFIFWSGLFSKIEPYFSRLIPKWTQVQSQK